MENEGTIESGRLATNVMPAGVKAEIANRLGVAGDFMRVPQVAKALGIAANSIYAQMRLGSFPIAHRRVGNVVVVKLDDYVRWFLADGLDSTMAKPTLRRSMDESSRLEKARLADGSLRKQESDEDKMARLKREVRAGMRRKGLV